LRSRVFFFPDLLLNPLHRTLHLRNEIVDWRIVVKDPNLELRWIFDEFLHVPPCRAGQWHGHRNVSYPCRSVFLWVGVKVHRSSASRVDRDRTAEPAPVTPLEKAILDFGGPNVFELVDADHREVLIERVDALAAGRLTIVGEQHARLVDAVDVRRLRKELGKLRAGLASQ